MNDHRHNGGPPIDDESNPYNPTGWIRIARDIREHHLVGFGKVVKPADDSRGFCFSRGEAWLDLLMECRYMAGTVVNKGKRMEIKPGQLLGAVSWLGHRWNWTPKTVRWFLDQLQTDKMIERETEASVSTQTENRASPDDSLNGIQSGKRSGNSNGNQIGMLTISNYEIYQLAVHLQRQAKGQAERQPNGNPAASARQANGNTLIKEEGNNILSEGERARAAPAKIEEQAQHGEEPVGHGVFVNGKTIRHAKFAISLDAIQMQTLNSGLSFNDLKAVCQGHALQWGLEIENGALPRDVLPSKITNFLAASVTSMANKAKAQGVRMTRVQRGFDRPEDADKAETQAQRFARQLEQIERKGSTP
jgi:hypothetical protein